MKEILFSEGGGPCAVTLAFYFEVPKSWPKKKRHAALAGKLYMESPPDLDNLEKSVLDACNEIVFDDDRRVVNVLKVKAYATKAATHVNVQPLVQWCV